MKSMSKPQSVRLYMRYFLVFLTLPILLMAVFCWYEFHTLMKSELSILETRERYRVFEKVVAMRQALEVTINHTQSLTQEPQNRGSLNSGDIQKIKETLGNALTTLMYRNPNYIQARWIDNSGMELVRIDRNHDGIFRVPEDQLQDKRNRDYVRHCMGIGTGQVYISGLDLNVEHNKIEVPYRPTLRFCSHYFRADGSSMGIFVINTSAKSMFEEVRVNPDETGQIKWFMVNSFGQWLIGPKKEDEWGMVLGHNHNIKTYAPHIWPRISRSPAGQFVDARGMWSWRAVQPSEARPDIIHAEDWNIIAFIPNSEIEFIRKVSMLRALRNCALILPIMVILSLVGAYFQLKRRQAIQELADRIQEEYESQAKGEFLANMSHEIRTPMNAVIGLLQVLTDSPQTPYQKDIVRKIMNAAQALLGILNDILDYSKIEAGQLELSRDPFVIDDIFHKLSDLFAVAAGMKGIELIFGYDKGLPMVLEGDAQRLTQILGNLIGNAVKFTSHGHITISVAVEHWEAEEITLVFSVRDTGIGMKQDTIDKIFMPFVQADAGTSRRFGGSGLGLSISRHLVRHMGGEIRVSSEPGVGSRFSFSANFHARTKSRLVRNPKLEGHRVLILDASDEVRSSLMNMLEIWGMVPVVYNSVAEALEGVQEHTALSMPFDFIITDFNTLAMSHNPFFTHIDGVFEGGRMVHPYTVLLVSASQSADISQYPSVSAVLSKPVLGTRLLDTLLAWDAEETVEERAAMAKKRGSLIEMAEPIHGARVLLVEDNLLNQEVASTLLRKMGLQLEIANNGLEAVEMAENGGFDIILMDLQMPVMDGFDATQIIRKKPNCAKIPIIAMTAAVFDKDRQAAINTGMNDHISKPIDTDVLLKSLLRHISPEVRNRVRNVALPVELAEPARPPEAGLPESLPGFDLEAAKLRLMDDQPLLLQMMRRFLRDYQGFRAKLLATIAEGDFEAAMRLAHTLKGASGTIGAVQVQSAAAEAEAVLRDGMAPDSMVMCDTLDATLELLERSLPEVRKEKASGPLQVQKALSKLKSLEETLNRHGVVSDEEMLALNQCLGEMAGSAIVVELNDQIDRFDYSGAQESLKTLLVQISGAGK